MAKADLPHHRTSEVSMTTLKSLLSTLEHAREALQFAKPTHAHYPEPVKRHAQALAVLFLTVMLWAYAVDRPGALSSLLTLGTMQSGIVETE